MKKVALDKLVPGMVLAKPIESGNGMVLLAEGTALSDKWIERLETMDIAAVWVEGKTEQSIPLEEALAALDMRFEPVLGAPYMTDLKRLVRDKIEQLYM